MLDRLDNMFHKISNAIGTVALYATIAMIAIVFCNVIARYFFNTGSIGLQELEWHFFGIMILLGVAYNIRADEHVRVDMLYDKYSLKTQAIINMVGVVLFIIPFALLVAFDSIGFAVNAYEIQEKSGDPGGLHYRFIIKSFIPLSFFLIAICGIGFFIKNLQIYKKEHKVY